MFSVENFYFVLYTNLLRPATPLPLHAFYFYPFGTTGSENLASHFGRSDNRWIYQDAHGRHRPHVFFYDQEPLMLEAYEKVSFEYLERRKNCKILANSEHSDVKKLICKQDVFVDWYYFFHGFAALDWYRNYQYFPKLEKQFTKVFMSLNRLVVNDRSYRLQLVALLLQNDLVDKGIVSLQLENKGYGTWKDEVLSDDCKLSTKGKALVAKYISRLPGPIVADREDPQGNLSADVSLVDYHMMQDAFLHVVSETVFYYPKLHLTEKIFKPIIARRPFVLVAAPGNLAYFKSYGFKTFDRWIDESYDSEQDNDKRLELIAKEIKKLADLPMEQLHAMHKEMEEVLDYNFEHFYGKFKEIITDEMLENFKSAVHQWNHARIDERAINLSAINFEEVRARLLR